MSDHGEFRPEHLFQADLVRHQTSVEHGCKLAGVIGRVNAVLHQRHSQHHDIVEERETHPIVIIGRIVKRLVKTADSFDAVSPDHHRGHGHMAPEQEAVFQKVVSALHGVAGRRLNKIRMARHRAKARIDQFISRIDESHIGMLVERLYFQ